MRDWKIEHNIGEIFKLGIDTYQCVKCGHCDDCTTAKTDTCNVCDNCALNETDTCMTVICSGSKRKDHTTVYYKRLLSGSSEQAEQQKRHIELAVVKVEDDKVTFEIITQTHREYEFSQQADSCEFLATNGIKLLSWDYPEWRIGGYRLFLFGCNRNCDLHRVICTAVEFAEISKAVAEYNETNGKGYEKPWPQKGDDYFYITKEGTVDRCIYTGSEIDYKMRSFGNCFRAAKAAEMAADRVRKAMKG